MVAQHLLRKPQG